MIDTLANDNTQVLPGDVLLLRSKGLLAVLNRFAQRALRPARPLHLARFTHVALVISRTHIADAIPNKGVRMRRWIDAADAYDQDRCVVVRHPALASDPEKQQALLARVQYYYNQRYKLSSLATRKVKHNRGLVCSQFVALVLDDLGLPPVVRAAMQGLPSDIDRNTRGRNGWRQFPFREYGLYADACRRLAGQANRKGPGDSQPALDSMVPATDIATKTPATDLAMKLSDAVGDLLAGSMGDLENVSRLTAEFDRAVLKSIDALRALPDGLELGEGSPHANSSEVFSAARLLDSWTMLYLRTDEVKVRTLADEDAPKRLARHQRLLGEAIDDIVALVRTGNSQVEEYMASAGRIRELAGMGTMPELSLVSSMYELGTMISKPMEWLREESTDSIMARCKGYPEAGEALSSVRSGLGEESEKLARNQLSALFDLERECLTWVTTSRPVVLKLTEMFSSLLCTLSGSHEGVPEA